ncbi:MAG: hypothetical protein DME26_15770, partial [Verrucomicrobia bacterium]
TPGTNNAAIRVSDVVINEIMYHPISEDADDEFVELHNRSANSISLAGWKLSDAITFTFPTNAVIPPNGYLVVAHDAVRLMTNYANLNPANTLGNFAGTLSDRGDRLALTMPDLVVTFQTNNNVVTATTNLIHITVDEETYGTGGRWGKWSDGGGSSLERVDPHSDGRLAPHWADSDETAKSGWVNIEFTGVLDNGNGTADSLQIFLQGAGECLIDDVEVSVQGGANLVPNSTFEDTVTNWFFQGTHDRSAIELAEGFNSSRSLHIRASGRGDTGANRIRTPLTTTLSSGTIATLRAKARWLSGNPEILLRLHGNWIEAPGYTLNTRQPGTPGARNSRAVANVGPAIYNVSHTPVLPTSGQAVTVTASVDDPDGVSSVALNYRIDPAATPTSIPMVYNGAGFYSATIPGQVSGTRLAFSLTATDNNLISATATFPSDAPNRECLIRFGEASPSGIYGAYHLWITQATLNRWATREKNSNEPLDATFAYGNYRVVYNIGALYSGSPWHTPGYSSPTGNMCDYVLNFPSDDRLLGAEDFVMASVGNLGSDDTGQREQTSFWIGYQLGTPYNYRRFVRMYVNGLQRGTIFEDSQQPSADVVKEWFADNPGGDLHKIEDWFEFDTTGDNKLFNVDATLQNFTTTGGTKKMARYRWNWRKRAVSDSANGYTNLFALVDAVNASGSAAYTAQVEALVDVDEWVRIIAMEHIVGNWDSYGFSRGKNMYAYKPVNDRWRLFPWDIDFTLGLGDPATAAILPTEIGVNDSVISRFLQHPPFFRTYLRALQDAVNGPLLSTRVNPLLESKYNSLVANGIAVSSPTAAESYIASRRSSIISKLATVSAPFALTSNNGNDFSTNRNLVILSGTAPFTVKTIAVNGISYPITWTSITNWTLRYSLSSGNNPLALQGFDNTGPVSGAATAITINYTGVTELPQDKLVINEIMYNPPVSQASYVEIYNASTANAFDLSGYRLDGTGFNFTDGTVIEPGAYVVVVKDRQVFAATYGNSTAVVGEFPATLSNNRDTIKLVKPGIPPAPEFIIDQVTYESTPPWPASANGFGPSLQLIDAAQDNNRVANWAAVTGGANPAPQWRYVTVTGTASSSTIYIYLQAAGDVYLDDMKLVAGSIAEAGANVIQNGDFETTFPGAWTVSPNLSASTRSTTIKHSGDASLHVIASSGGTTRASAIFQDFSPALPAGGAYTLSYWYLENTNGGTLTVRLSGSCINSTHTIAPGSTSSSLYTPGGPNSVRATLPAFPPLWTNELPPNNLSGITDRFGDRDPWVAIYNGGTSAINLGGSYLTDNYTDLTRWAFPSNTVINAGQFMVVWADGEPAESSATAGLYQLLRHQSGPFVRIVSRWECQWPAGVSFRHAGHNQQSGFHADRRHDQ